jgi:hypothetical protein
MSSIMNSVYSAAITVLMTSLIGCGHGGNSKSTVDVETKGAIQVNREKCENIKVVSDEDNELKVSVINPSNSAHIALNSLMSWSLGEHASGSKGGELHLCIQVSDNDILIAPSFGSGGGEWAYCFANGLQRSERERLFTVYFLGVIHGQKSWISKNVKVLFEGK